MRFFSFLSNIFDFHLYTPFQNEHFYNFVIDMKYIGSKQENCVVFLLGCLITQPRGR